MENVYGVARVPRRRFRALAAGSACWCRGKIFPATPGELAEAPSPLYPRRSQRPTLLLRQKNRERLPQIQKGRGYIRNSSISRSENPTRNSGKCFSKRILPSPIRSWVHHLPEFTHVVMLRPDLHRRVILTTYELSEGRLCNLNELQSHMFSCMRIKLNFICKKNVLCECK